MYVYLCLLFDAGCVLLCCLGGGGGKQKFTHL